MLAALRNSFIMYKELVLMIAQYVIITVVNTATTTTTTYPWRVSDTQNGATVRQFTVTGLSP